MTLKTMPKVGDKVRHLTDTWSFLTNGRVYEVIGVAEAGYALFVDDDGDTIPICDDELDEYELLTEATPPLIGHILVAGFSCDGTGEYELDVRTDAIGMATVQRLVDESNKEAELRDERRAIEQQIAQLQRKLEAFK